MSTVPETPAATGSQLTLEVQTGRNIRSLRLSRGFTLDTMAELTQLTKGQLSKIENGRVSAPISTLSRIADALETDPAILLRRSGRKGCEVLPHAIQVARREALAERSLHYERLFRESSIESPFEPMHGRLVTDQDLAIYQYPGAVFIQILSGRVVYQFEEDRHPLGPGDILYCEGRIPHGPVEILEGPVEFLLIMGHPRA